MARRNKQKPPYDGGFHGHPKEKHGLRYHRVMGDRVSPRALESTLSMACKKETKSGEKKLMSRVPTKCVLYALECIRVKNTNIFAY